MTLEFCAYNQIWCFYWHTGQVALPKRHLKLCTFLGEVVSCRRKISCFYWHIGNSCQVALGALEGSRDALHFGCLYTNRGVMEEMTAWSLI